MADLLPMFCAAALCLGTDPPQSLPAESPPQIRNIEIVAHDVFEDSGQGQSLPYRVANALHVRTRESVIRRELLVAQGEPLDAEAIAQTERNLRAMRFLRAAEIEVVPATAPDGEPGEWVDVRVSTWDAWSTSPDIRLSKTANRTLWSVGMGESNLLGTGREVQVLRRRRLERDDTLFFFRDPRLAGSRVQFATSYSDGTDGSSRTEVILSRPYFSLATEWAFGAHLETFDRPDGLYEAGERVAEVRHVRRWQQLEVSRAIHRGATRAVRFHLGYRHREDEVEGDPREFGIVEVGISTVQHRFVELNHVNRFERTEDFNLGAESSARFGVSTSALGGEPGTAYFFTLAHRQALQFGPEHFVQGSLSWNARHRRGRLENSRLDARLAYLNRTSSRSLLLARARLTHGYLLDPEVQVTLGAHNGMRGYPVHQFVGDRSLLLSLEQRFFVADDVARLVSLGIAAFVDSGFAWQQDQPFTVGDLHTDIGFGLLLGRNRISTSQPTVRVDLAYALDPVPGRGRWQIVAGSEIEF